MNVEIISYTHGASEVCAMAANGCYSETPASEISLSKKDIERILTTTIKSGHLSILEHAVYTFSISGVSRILTHQLVRHRMASYSQQSQRYVKMDDPMYVVPKIIDNLSHIDSGELHESRRIFEVVMDKAWAMYNELLILGIPEEDARYVLPGACCTNITVTMNARELLHFFELRLCNKAQWEIRELAECMLELCMEQDPLIFRFAGAPCQKDGCRETRPCGNPRDKNV
jgi:thymidylate synthase (FAD)